MFVINFILNVFIPRLNEYNENLIAQLFIRVPLLPLRHFLKFSLSLLLSKELSRRVKSMYTGGLFNSSESLSTLRRRKKKKKRKSRLQADKHLSNGVAVKAVTGDGVDVNPADREPGSPLGPVAEEKKKGKGERKKERKSGGQPRSFKLSSLALSLSPPTGHPLRLFYLLLLLLLFFSFFFLFRAIHNLLYPR